MVEQEYRNPPYTGKIHVFNTDLELKLQKKDLKNIHMHAHCEEYGRRIIIMEDFHAVLDVCVINDPSFLGPW